MSPPETGFIKINYDGAIFLETSEVGIGIVARDSNGSCIGWLSKRFCFNATPEIIETIAAREAVLLGIRRGWQKIVLEGDCSNLFYKQETESGSLSHWLYHLRHQFLCSTHGSVFTIFNS
ncbi:UNVERIFIED_CONTAM: hypothetical protein Sradi_2297300 [Sesamum radiatum]|uniref:RNase H type-1 domain-containing protein n=1 Tax=Sesamum radiatum TaxID=300843 RepID=A0AAW2T552_SESRA